MRQSQFRDLIAPCADARKTGLGDAIRSGSLPKGRLRSIATQFYLQEKWPSHIAHVYLNLDDKTVANQEVIAYIIDIIQAENLGVGSDGVAHSELASRFAASVGVTAQELRRASPTPQNRALMDWCDLSALGRPWIEALAVQMACESQVALMAQIEQGLREHYGVSGHDAAFWSVHGGNVEREHARRGFLLLSKHTTRRNAGGVLYAYDVTCRLQMAFYESLM